MIYDEAQRAKNFRTKTARTIQQIPSRFAFVLTGTPVENRLDDLYSLMQVVDPSVFGPLWKFNLEFHQQSETGKIVGYKNLSALRERIAPVVLRRRKEEILTQLPALTEQTRYTPLTAAQQELEEGYRQQAGQLMAKAARRGLTKKEQDLLMMLLLKARQACNAAELCDPKRRGSPKLDEFESLISEIASQGTSKILVFSEWVEMLKLAARRLDSARHWPRHAARRGADGASPSSLGALPRGRRHSRAALDRSRRNRSESSSRELRCAPRFAVESWPARSTHGARSSHGTDSWRSRQSTYARSKARTRDSKKLWLGSAPFVRPHWTLEALSKPSRHPASPCS